MNHHTAYIKYLCYTCCASFFQTPLTFFYHWTNLVAVCFTMKHHTAYKIPLLHLLRFFKPSLDFFLPLNRPLQFVSQCTSILPVKYLCYTCCAFFQTPLIFYHHLTNLVAVGFTMKHHTAYKIPLLHLLRFFRTTLNFFLPLTRPLQFVSQ